MAIVTNDRRQGVNSSKAIKVPVYVATTGNITLSGEQSIDGVSVTAGMRVLVKNQTNSVQNGIYEVSTGSWTRAFDFDGQLDTTEGTIVLVLYGSTYGNTWWRLTTANAVIGTSNITFVQNFLSAADSVSFVQAGTGAVTRDSQSKMRERFSPEDFGAVGDFSFSSESGTDDYTAFANAVAACPDGGAIRLGPKAYYIASTLVIAKSVSFIGDVSGGTKLVFGDCNGLTYNLGSVTTNTNTQVVLQDLSILTTVKGTRDAVTMTGTSSDRLTNQLVVQRVFLSGADSYKDGAWTGQAANWMLEWLNAVNLTECDGALFHDVTIRGNERCAIEAYGTHTTGIKATDSSHVELANVRILRIETGVVILGQSEGSFIHNCNIVACKVGVHYSGLSVPANQHLVTNSHIAANEIGIYMPLGASSYAASYNVMSGNFLLKRIEAVGPYYTGSGYSGYQGICMYGNNSILSGNSFSTNVNADMVAIGDKAIVIYGDDNNVFGNVALNPGTHISIESGAARTACYHNSTVQTGVQPLVAIANAGTATIDVGNTDPTASEFVLQTTVAQKFKIAGIDAFGVTSVANQDTWIDTFGDTAANAYATLRARSTSAADVDVKLLPKGSGYVRFGTHAGSADAPISGYITIKDEAGTTRKLAVIS